MLPDLHVELLASNLLAGRAAAEAVAAGWRVELLAPVGAITEMFVTTYRLRLAHVRKLDGPHWQQLADSTEEFVRNLETQVGSLLESMTITGSHRHHFVVFRLSGSARILGCMCVIPNMESSSNHESVA